MAPSWSVLGPSWPRLTLPAPPKSNEIPWVFQYFCKFRHFCFFSGPKGILTRLEGVLEPSLAVLGASWRRLGPSWRRLGASWSASWPPKTLPRSLQDASKTPPKTRSNIDPTWKPSRTKNIYKTPAKVKKKKTCLEHEREARLSWTNGSSVVKLPTSKN